MRGCWSRGSAALFIAAVTTVGCALAGTRGRLAEVELLLRSESEAGGRLGVGTTVDPDPWTVELIEARVVIGAVYLFPPRDPTLALRWLLGPPRALAHAGDDNEIGSTAMAEHLDQVVVDALEAEPISLGMHLAQAGLVDRGSIWLDHPRGALARQGSAGPTRGHVGWVRARASRRHQVVELSVGLDIEPTPLRRRVDGIVPRGRGDLDSGVRATFGVVPGEWLREVDFEALVPPGHDFESDGPVRVSPEAPSQAHNAWQIALSRPTSYALSLEVP
jgi:hypothetical protein